jgi:hypothetical protein
VPKIDKVYGSATRVLAWLGEASEDSDYAMLLLEELAVVNPWADAWRAGLW